MVRSRSTPYNLEGNVEAVPWTEIRFHQYENKVSTEICNQGQILYHWHLNSTTTLFNLIFWFCFTAMGADTQIAPIISGCHPVATQRAQLTLEVPALQKEPGKSVNVPRKMEHSSSWGLRESKSPRNAVRTMSRSWVCTGSNVSKERVFYTINPQSRTGILNIIYLYSYFILQCVHGV